MGMKTQHTPGPWTVVGPCGPIKDQGDIEILGPSGITVAYTPRGHPTRSLERIANARLIAAAPEMLRILHVLLGFVEEGDGRSPLAQIMAEARALLAKIEGSYD